MRPESAAASACVRRRERQRAIGGNAALERPLFRQRYQARRGVVLSKLRDLSHCPWEVFVLRGLDPGNQLVKDCGNALGRAGEDGELEAGFHDQQVRPVLHRIGFVKSEAARHRVNSRLVDGAVLQQAEGPREALAAGGQDLTA